jgi:hypothetical protein
MPPGRCCPNAEITLLHVAPAEVEEAAAGALAGLLGRGRLGPGRHPAERIGALSEQAATELLAAAAARLGRAARRQAASGRVERVVVEAAEGADLLVAARDGDHPRLGTDLAFLAMPVGGIVAGDQRRARGTRSRVTGRLGCAWLRTRRTGPESSPRSCACSSPFNVSRNYGSHASTRPYTAIGVVNSGRPSGPVGPTDSNPYAARWRLGIVEQ